jgi:hypothetical protein
MTENTLLADILKDKNDVQKAWLYFLKYMMAVYLCDLPVSLEAEPLAGSLKKLVKQVGLYTRIQHLFHEGIQCCFLANASSRKTSRRWRSMLARARECLKALESFATVCPANYKNKAVLLKAEIETLEGNTASSDIIALYEESARLAKEEGFVHEQALALEKAGYHVLYIQENTDTASLARPFFKQAIEVWENYGALLKVQMLTKVECRLDDIVNLMTSRKSISQRPSSLSWRSSSMRS